MAKKSSFTLATLNVHSFSHPLDYKDNSRDLAELLRPLDLDLLALNEIGNDQQWTRFCELLSLPHHVYGAARDRYFGNGFASRYPIESHSNTQSTGTAYAEKRSLLHCRLGGEHPFAAQRTFAVTHLDHRIEEARVKQLEDFQPVENKIDILMGDLNALTRDDYSEEYFRRTVSDVREQSSWESPRFEVTGLLAERWNFRDAFKASHPHLQDEKISTCRFNTRIDYIFLRPREDERWTLRDCYILPTKGATDHNAVVARFERQWESSLFSLNESLITVADEERRKEFYKKGSKLKVAIFVQFLAFAGSPSPETR